MKLLALLATILTMTDAYGAEPVAKLCFVQPGLGGSTYGAMYALGNNRLMAAENNPGCEPVPDISRMPASTFRNIVDIMLAQTFSVYTTAEVDAALKQNASLLEERMNEKVQSTEKELRAEVIKAIDALPQRILADVGGQALKDAIITELRAEIERLSARLVALEAQQLKQP